MLTYIYDWIRNLAFYIVLVTMILQMLPDSVYKKYIRFFTGLVLILMLAEPILSGFHMKSDFEQLFRSVQYRQSAQEIRRAAEYFRQAEEGYLEQESGVDNKDSEQSEDSGKK